jgi:AcrR family transcriptional regulator
VRYARNRSWKSGELKGETLQVEMSASDTSKHSKEVLDAPEGRIEKKRRATRARLLEAAHEVMAKVGVDAAKIKDITDRADVGFGTFYNYFETKDEIAGQVLDCLINDIGRRNVAATQKLGRADPALVMPVSMRLFMREAARTPIWQWWALRPDLLVDRMRDGFEPFFRQVVPDVLERGIFHVAEEEVGSAWALANWMMAGGVHDIVVGQRPLESDMFVVNAIMRMMGMDLEEARRAASTPLPKYPAPDIDWTFQLVPK